MFQNIIVNVSIRQKSLSLHTFFNTVNTVTPQRFLFIRVAVSHTLQQRTNFIIEQAHAKITFYVLCCKMRSIVVFDSFKVIIVLGCIVLNRKWTYINVKSGSYHSA